MRHIFEGSVDRVQSLKRLIKPLGIDVDNFSTIIGKGRKGHPLHEKHLAKNYEMPGLEIAHRFGGDAQVDGMAALILCDNAGCNETSERITFRSIVCLSHRNARCFNESRRLRVGKRLPQSL